MTCLVLINTKELTYRVYVHCKRSNAAIKSDIPLDAAYVEFFRTQPEKILGELEALNAEHDLFDGEDPDGDLVA